MQFIVSARGPLFLFPTVIFISPSLKQKGQETTTQSYSDSYYFYNLTLIKDDSSSDCLTQTGPMLCLWEQSF